MKISLILFLLFTISVCHAQEKVDNKLGDFRRVKFSNDADFNGTAFPEGTDFTDATFSGKANFMTTEFSYAFFSYTQFSKEVSFNRATFNNDMWFLYCTFENELDVSQLQLPDNLSFYGNKLKHDVRFDLADIDSLKNRGGERCKLFLNVSTDIDKLVLDASKFELCFDNTTPYEEHLAVFEQVIKKCKSMGFNESAKGFDIDFQKLQINHKWGISAPAVIWLADYWWNFGYDKSKAYRNTAHAFLLSLLLFFMGFRYFMKVYLPPQLRLEMSTITKTKWTERFKVSLFYTALIFFSWKMEHQEVKYKEHPWGALIVYLVFTLGIIHLAYLAGAILNK